MFLFGTCYVIFRHPNILIISSFLKPAHYIDPRFHDMLVQIAPNFRADKG